MLPNRDRTGRPGATVGGQVGSFTVTNEMIGRSCLSRTSRTTVRVSMSWHAVGRLLDGNMTTVLYDCTTRTYTSKYVQMSCPRGSRSNYGTHVPVTFTVAGSHRYKVRLSGAGTYIRKSNGVQSAINGHFYGVATNRDVPKWVGYSTCA